ncbi:MAG: Uma2 family endonuclease [Pseudanabaena sp. Salubria-1]|jgi:Uma2 family endonuclease|nr:Uma2 family endonuclease [Pseudanabaena sp. Salubria-1]
MTAVISPQKEQIILKGIHWETYKSLVRDLEAQPSKRLTYDNGVLEIRMPLPPHERYKKWLGRLVEIITEELGIEIASLGSCTWSRDDLRKGLEPDECYYIQNEAAVRGKETITLSVDPPPDLAIEVDSTSSSLDRMGIYAALGVPEVWRYDFKVMTFWVLVDSVYVSRETSIALPLVTATAVQVLLSEAVSMGETSWAKRVRAWIQNSI